MLTSLQEQFLRGTLLGDTHMAGSSSNPWLRFGQGEKQLSYLNHKVSMLSGYTHSRLERYTHPGNGGVHFQQRFRSNPDFAELYREFYPEGKKKITESQVKLLTFIGLAYWIADDGTVSRDERPGFNASDTCRLFIGRQVDQKVVEGIVEILNSRFAECKLTTGTKSAWSVAFSAKSSQDLALEFNALCDKAGLDKHIRPRRALRRALFQKSQKSTS